MIGKMISEDSKRLLFILSIDKFEYIVCTFYRHGRKADFGRGNKNGTISTIY